MNDSVDHYQLVCEQVADVLAVDRDEIKPESRFFADLGGESIELLELSFQLEKRLRCRVSFTSLFSGEALATDERGIVRSEALADLVRRYPFLPVQRLKPEPRVEDLQDLLTIRVLAELVRLAIEAPANDTTAARA